MPKAMVAILVIVSSSLAAPHARLLSAQSSVRCDHVLGLTYVKASVNGSKPLTMVLDSGAFYSVLQPEVAVRLHLKVSGTLQTTGLAANATLHMVRDATLTFAGESLSSQTISVLPVDYVAQEAGHQTDGLLGGNVFTKFVVVEHYQAHVISLVPAADFTPPADYTSVPVVVSGNLGFVQLTLAGVDGSPIEGTFLIDSGTVGTMIVMKAFMDAHPSLQPKKLVDIPSVTAVGGAMEIVSGRLGQLRLGPYSLDGVAAAFLRSTNPNTPSTLAGMLGSGILRKFDVIFDYPHDKLWLKPNADFRTPFPEPASGMLLEVKPPRYRVVLVRNVIEGSPAAEAGVKPGDRILRIRVGSGALLAPTSLSSVTDTISTPGEHITLEVSRAGKRMTLRFETRSLI